MASRAVGKTRKDRDGDILALCDENDGAFWSPRLKRDAIADIESRLHSYYVQWSGGGGRTDIHVVNDPVKGKYLRTDRDSTARNNLDDLPDC